MTTNVSTVILDVKTEKDEAFTITEAEHNLLLCVRSQRKPTVLLVYVDGNGVPRTGDAILPTHHRFT